MNCLFRMLLFVAVVVAVGLFLLFLLRLVKAADVTTGKVYVLSGLGFFVAVQLQ